jgi:type IV pilus assembly protein PilB
MSVVNGTVLLVDDDPNILRALRRVFLDDAGIEILTSTSGEEGLALMSSVPVDLVISDHKMPEMDGVEFLSRVRERHPGCVRMMMTGYEDVQATMEAVNRGEIRRFFNKPWDNKEIREAVTDGIRLRALDREITELVREGVLAEEHVEAARQAGMLLDDPFALTDVLVELGHMNGDDLERHKALKRSRQSLAAILHEEGLLDREGLAKVNENWDEDPNRSEWSLLVETGLISEEQYVRTLGLKYGVPYEEPEIGLADHTLLGQASLPYLIRRHALPYRIQDDELSVFVSDPSDRELLQEMERIYGVRLRVACCTPDSIVRSLRALDKFREGKGSAYQGTIQYREILREAEENETGDGTVQTVDYLIVRAVQMGASDLHVEPQQDRVRVRVRVDGVLTHLTDLPGELSPQVVSRFKILAGADIAERRLHQDGRIFVKVDDREIDVRVSTYVTMYGEVLVLRLLDRNRGLIPLDTLGFERALVPTVKDHVLRSSSGIVLVTGPTGSGKTTTLYSFIQEINDTSLKVITCEDPVEYVLPGIVQCSVNQKTGPTFVDSLRAILRQDPDVILVGEIRDLETARLAVEAGLTGHRIFSTLHTEDAVGAVTRLLDMGVEPFLVSSTMTAVVAQRLVRRICKHCQAQHRPEASDLRIMGIRREEAQEYNFLKGFGCTRCGGTGYRGRTAIHELLLPGDEFRDAILERAPSRILRELARKSPAYLTLQEDGLFKAMSGITTLEEVIAQVPRDPAMRPVRDLEKLLDTPML